MTSDKTNKNENLNILALEDSARDFELIKEQLIDAGYTLRIERVETEDAYTASLRDKVWDVILADFKLHGFDAFGALRIRNEICPDTPFICVSGSIGEETAIELLKSGAVDYVIKDRPDRLPFAIGRALDEAREKKIRIQNDDALKAAYSQLKTSQGEMQSILKNLRAEIQARQAKEAELQKVNTAVEQAGEVVFITDIDGTIQYVNPSFTNVSGYSREEAIGKNPSMLKSGKQDLAFYQDLWKTITSGKTWSGRMVNKRKDGTLFTEEATISAVRDSAGNIVNYVAVKHDITEHLHLTAQLQQAQKMESIGRLAGGVAHDYNNALSAIIGFTELSLDDVGPSGTLNDNLLEVLNAARRATDITRQLLAFARKQSISPSVLDLNENIENMLKMLRRLIGEDIDFTWSPGPSLWPIRMDPSQIDQILANLCVNARDAIENVGKITIATSNVSFDAGDCVNQIDILSGDFVMLAVSDNGCGMEKQILDNIFEPFFTTKEVDKGTGLGLATVYGIVKQNNGFINVYSEPGKGTTFKIYLTRQEGEAVELQDEITMEIPQGKGETILVVEDDLSILKLARKILSNTGYNVLTAGTPAEGIDLAEKHPGEIHLLITDVIMPGMNGREFSERLQSSSPNLKCIFMSGYTANVIAHHGVLDKGVQFIQKPFSRIDLARTVRKVLDG